MGGSHQNTLSAGTSLPLPVHTLRELGPVVVAADPAEVEGSALAVVGSSKRPVGRH